MAILRLLVVVGIAAAVVGSDATASPNRVPPAQLKAYAKEARWGVVTANESRLHVELKISELSLAQSVGSPETVTIVVELQSWSMRARLAQVWLKRVVPPRELMAVHAQPIGAATHVLQAGDRVLNAEARGQQLVGSFAVDLAERDLANAMKQIVYWRKEMKVQYRRAGLPMPLWIAGLGKPYRGREPS